MTLSEAMRLGAMVTPQAFGLLRDGEGTCALGAAYVAVGLLKASCCGIATAHARFPVLATEATCPLCGYIRELDSIVAHLNDDHYWTREQIADFVETIEAHQVQPAPALVEVTAQAVRS